MTTQLLKLTTDGYKASRGLSAAAELLVKEKSCCDPENSSTQIVCNNNGFTVHADTETCSVCDPRQTAGEVATLYSSMLLSMNW